MMNEESQYPQNTMLQDSKAHQFKELTWTVMQSSHYIKTLPEVDLEQLERKKVSLPYLRNYTSVNPNWRKTMVFDIDETLVHKINENDSNQEADIYVDVPTEDNSEIHRVSLKYYFPFEGSSYSYSWDST